MVEPFDASLERKRAHLLHLLHGDDLHPPQGAALRVELETGHETCYTFNKRKHNVLLWTNICLFEQIFALSRAKIC